MPAMSEAMKETFSNARVCKDLRKILEEGDWRVELEGRVIEVPPTVGIDIVARSYHVYDYAIGFGNHYRVLVGLGGVRCSQNGVVEALLGFATMWYSEENKVITVDFSAAMP